MARARNEASAPDRGSNPIVVWLRDDLRLDDNPALAHAASTGRPLVLLFVLDEAGGGSRPMGAAMRWWLHQSLASFCADVARAGSSVVLRRGRGVDVVPAILRETEAGALFYNRRYHPDARARDAAVDAALPGIAIERFDAHILHDPDRTLTKTGGPYRVYTPFWRSLAQGGSTAHGHWPRGPIAAPEHLPLAPKGLPESERLADWQLRPTSPDWSGSLSRAFPAGEAAAHSRLSAFLKDHLADYHEGRERPAEDATSKMSPYLRFGTISPHRIWHLAETAARERRDVAPKAIETFQKELVWRDFNYHLLYHFGRLEEVNFNTRFDAFPWASDPEGLAAWQRGMTGYPIVDAAMRQLWQTGWMHNRMRMITASFLTKDLLIDWREGERWFWDTLIDGDAASNTAQWQWVAGSGADAQPFFRIFNPVSQGRKFDADGAYVRHFVPELANLPDDAIHAPWEADSRTLARAGVVLGKTYPEPIVDHAKARARALAAYGATQG